MPLGGFVRIVGMSPYEEVPPEDQPRSYPNKPKWQRAILLVAGSATHWVVAFLILFITAMTLGFPTGDATTEIASLTDEVQGEESPAAEAGVSAASFWPQLLQKRADSGLAAPQWGQFIR